MPSSSQPLAGLRILDVTHHVAGPFATRLLAAYGADVIKIEPPGGDPARRAPSSVDGAPAEGVSTRFLYLNTDKRSLVLDLRSNEGRERFLALARDADAVVENFAPGVLDALGLGWPVLHALKPRLVLTSISNFGQTGPHRDWAGTNLTLFAAGGQMGLTGDPDREPLVNGGTQALMQAGLHGFAATVTAIFGARRSGRGAWVDISIQEVQAASLEGAGPAALWYGTDGMRTGNRLSAMWGIYPCADGFVGCSVLERNVPNLLRAIGREDLLTDPQFRDPAWRLANNDEVVAVLLAFFMEHTKQELLAIAQRYRVPFGYIATVEELLAWPALAEKGFWREVDHPEAGRLRYPGPPFTIDGGESFSLKLNPDTAFIQPWQLRDIRRTAATILAELGHPIEVVDKILNHANGRSGSGRTINSVARIYIKHEFLEERRRALQDLGEYIRKLVQGNP